MQPSTKTSSWLLLLIRIWLGYNMAYAGGGFSSVRSILFIPRDRAFFVHWFGDELHYPFPLAMAFLAKFTELFGGTLVFVGLFSRISASLIAFTMLMATLTANLGQNFSVDGNITISYTIFSMLIIVWGGGNFSLDHLLFKNKNSRLITF
jgi:putative oxidoreductase